MKALNELRGQSVNHNKIHILQRTGGISVRETTQLTG